MLMIATLPRLVMLKEGDLLQGRMRNMAAKKTALNAVRLQIPSFSQSVQDCHGQDQLLHPTPLMTGLGGG